jgi:hypothetical protein
MKEQNNNNNNKKCEVVPGPHELPLIPPNNASNIITALKFLLNITIDLGTSIFLSRLEHWDPRCIDTFNGKYPYQE